MDITHPSRIKRSLFLIDIFAILSGLYLASVARSTIPFGRELALSTQTTRLPMIVYIVAVLSWILANIVTMSRERIRIERWFNTAFRILQANFLTVALLAGFLYFSYRNISRLQIIYGFLLTVILQILVRIIVHIYYRIVKEASPDRDRRILILGAGDVGQRLARSLGDHAIWGYHVIGFLDDDPEKAGNRYSGATVLGEINRLSTALKSMDIDEIWITLPLRANELVQGVVKDLETLPVRIYLVPDYFSLALVQARAEVFDGIPVIGLRDSVIGGNNRRLKRLLDIIISSILLLILSPLFLLIAVVILLSAGKPVYFQQERVGENLEPFQMHKFRTMVRGAEANQDQVVRLNAEGHIIHKIRDDQRVTRVGRFLRRFSLDELPQLWNVFRGDMSLVGPRPEMPWLVDKYESWQRKRFAVPQGITGWWQINERSDKPMHLNTELDLYYVYNYSLWLDLLILLRTPLEVIRGRGAF